jgi:iron-sulfur cluster repair protein YtfE (RIC family)
VGEVSEGAVEAPSDPTEETVEGALSWSPRAAEILRGLGIDACCGGRLTLAQAAASAGVPVATVLEALGADGRDAT